MLSWLVIAFLPRSKHLLLSWLHRSSAVILEPKKIKSFTVSIVSPSICHEVMGRNVMISVFWMLNLSQLFHFPLSLSSRGCLQKQKLLFSPAVMYGYWELDHKEGWALKNWCFWTVLLEKILQRIIWTARRSNQSILKEISPEYSWEGLML